MYTCFWSILVLSLGGFLSSCAPSGSASKGEGSFQVEGTFSACQMDSIRVYMVDGLALRPLLSAPIQSSGDSYSFELRGDLPSEGMYFIGQAPRNLRGILLGNEKGVKISGNCLNLQGYMKVENSPSNEALEAMNGRISQFYQQSREVARQFVPSKVSDPNREVFLRKGLNRVVKAQFSYLDSLKNENPTVAKLFSLNLQELFDPTDNPEGYENEVDHLGGEMLAHSDLSDPIYAYLPVHDAVKTFVPQLFGTTLSYEKAKGHLDQFLSRIPEGSQTHKNVLAAVINSLEQMSSAAFPEYANAYVQLYNPEPALKENILNRAQAIKKMIEERKAAERITKIGATPPEIRLPDRAGKPFKWESLKGKTVLLDFWASWCGPCRRENPNVVRLYNQYKDKGFEILGVSLDKDRGQWLQAIEQDDLSWEHVSDLKGWRNEAALTYRVSSIPATFLLDGSGKIIGKNLRGRSLEAKLAELFAN
ncbi:MAG: TlpA disulfide reductase family protein [Bacteroidota bacterium]